ncbi:MAG: bifunctional adenosylcobinamide kinase/adenosylcobinamide-phosphate guanylyltransferase [Gaiellaceae bacterium]
MSLVVLLGGARSGKSRLALELATGEVTFIATGEPRDEEMAERIAAHRAERPAGWTTVEEPIELRRALENARGTAVVDCLSLWVANALERGGAASVEAEGAEAARVAAERDGLTVAVSNEVGLGVVPANELARVYRDVLGRVNASWVAASERAYLVVAGRKLALEP